jgi:hypothetical protein
MASINKLEMRDFYVNLIENFSDSMGGFLVRADIRKM